MDFSLLGDMDLLSGWNSLGWLSHACHGSDGCSWASRKTTGEPDGLTTGLGLQVLIELSLLLLLGTTGAGSVKYSMDEYWHI